MSSELLFYKDHFIEDDHLNIVFHKDYTYLYNDTTPSPVVQFTLRNCSHLSDIPFDNIDHYNDGVIAEIDTENGKTVFRTTDMGGVEVRIVCDEVIRQDGAYRQRDLIDIIKSTKQESDDNDHRATVYGNRIDDLKKLLNHDLVVINTKLEQANWLKIERRQFLEGQKFVIEKILDLIAAREKENLQRSTEQHS